MAISVRESAQGFAAAVSGVDLREHLSVEDVAAIDKAIDRNAVVIFRHQTCSDEEQLAFAWRLGVPERSTDSMRNDRPQRLAHHQVMADISNLNEKNEILAKDDWRRMFNLGNRLWHTDSSFRQIRGKHSMLSARAVPAAGGETEYADLRAAYDALPEAMKAQLEGLVAEHSLMYSRSTIGFADFSPEERAALPPAHHAIVQVHPGSGRKTLYLASHASHIIGWPIPEARILLRDLIEFATQRQFVYRHQWQVGDFVIWDNRATMHRGRPFDEANQRRDLRRVTTQDLAAVPA